jgi:hypothetical protein
MRGGGDAGLEAPNARAARRGRRSMWPGSSKYAPTSGGTWVRASAALLGAAARWWKGWDWWIWVRELILGTIRRRFYLG